jgi:2-oxoglutarate ferredoxin oxidoreductase subunit delta
MVEVKDDWCKGCNLCIINCPRGALTISKRFNKRGIHPPEMAENNSCNNCRMCELVCPDFAITVLEGREKTVVVLQV